MQFSIEAMGSHGDVIPFFEVASELGRRGHDAHVYGNGKFEGLARAKGVAFSATSSAALADAILNDPRATDSRRGLELLGAGLSENVENVLAILREGVRPDTFFVGSTLAFASRLAAELHHRPFVPVHLAPSLYRSEYRAPRFSPLGHFEAWPRWFKRAVYGFMDKRFLDPVFCSPLNDIRTRLGLAPVARVFHSWIHQGPVDIAAFPEWFAPRQPDWPTHVRFTGFPLPRPAHEPDLPADLEAFVSGAEPPIVFTAGTANTSSHSFYAESAAACTLLRRRGVLVAQRRDQLPRDLPDNVKHAAFVPFSTLFPRAAAVVHHGGIGTLSQALAAGVPQLIQPMAYDQFDNASRARRLGVAEEILPRRYLAATVAKRLHALLASSPTAAACARIRGRVTNEDGVRAICDQLEDLGFRLAGGRMA